VGRRQPQVHVPRDVTARRVDSAYQTLTTERHKITLAVHLPPGRFAPAMPAIEVIPRRGLPRSPLRYPGGKASLAGFFNAIIARRGLDTYVEPYAGGAGAAIELLLTDCVSEIVINDLDPAIYCFWYAITHSASSFLDRLADTPLTLDEWRTQQEIYRSGDQGDGLALGFATFYLNRTNRSGVMNAGVIGGQRQEGRYRIDARYDKDSLAKRIKAIADQHHRIKVTNEDGVRTIRRAIRRKAALIYADPPYYDKGSFLYLNSFGDAQHEELASVLNARADRNWILTYDDHEPIRNLYADRKHFNFKLHYSAHQRTQVAELMVISDNLSPSIAIPAT
jgi:DNA adenine methylase